MKDAVVHRLSFVLRFRDHFLGRAVPDEMPVRLAESGLRPVPAPHGGERQSDGTYRFRNLPPGVHRVLFLPPFERAHRGWTTWDPPLVVTLPLADETEVIERELWPSTEAGVPAGTTAIRGKLVGGDTANLEVRVDRAPGRFTRSDRFGEFLFLLTGVLPVDAPLVDPQHPVTTLTLSVPGRVVSARRIVPDDPLPVPGAAFPVRCGGTFRVRFEVH